MWVPSLFSSYERSLNLTAKQQRRLDSAVRVVGNFARHEEHLGYVAGDPFYQGSNASGLLVRPFKANQKFDVDMALPVRLDCLAWGNRSPSHVLPYIAKRLRNYYDRNAPPGTRPRIKRTNRCIRVDYVGEFHLDVVPMIVKSATRVQVLDYRDDRLVLKNHPSTITNYVDELDRQWQGYFRRCVRLLRRWRDAKLGAATAPNSLLLTVLAGRALEQRTRQGSYAYRRPLKTTGRVEVDTMFSDLLLVIRSYLENYPQGFFRDPLPVPGNEDEDLDDSWDSDDRDVLYEKIHSASEKAFEAVQEDTTQARTLKLWGQILGQVP